MTCPTKCPGCGVELEYKYDGETYCRAVGRYDLDLDKVVEWRCPDCGHILEMKKEEKEDK